MFRVGLCFWKPSGWRRLTKAGGSTAPIGYLINDSHSSLYSSYCRFYDGLSNVFITVILATIGRLELALVSGFLYSTREKSQTPTGILECHSFINSKCHDLLVAVKP